MNKNAEQDIGRGAEVEARQAEDGSFELVVSDSAAHAAVSEEAAQRHRQAEGVPLEVAAVTPDRLKRLGLLVLLIALLTGGLIYAFSGSKEKSADTVQSSQAQNDGFQPYGGGGQASPKATGGASQNEMSERLKAGDRDDDERGVDPRPEPLEAQGATNPLNPTNSFDEESEDEWELDEAELLEEARALERAEEAANQEAEASDMDEEEEEEYEDELDEPQEEGATGIEEEQEAITPARERAPRILAPKLERGTPGKINRYQQMRPVEKRPPLRGMRGLQRREAAQDELPLGEQTGDGEEEYWDEGEEDDRVPDFGRD